MVTTRWAARATSRSWVISTMVRPLSFSAVSSPMIPRPGTLSRALAGGIVGHQQHRVGDQSPTLAPHGPSPRRTGCPARCSGPVVSTFLGSSDRQRDLPPPLSLIVCTSLKSRNTAPGVRAGHRRSTIVIGLRTIGGRGAAVVAAGALALTTLTGAYFAMPASADTGTPSASNTGTLAGTPCTVTARACVDLDKQKAWLATAGKVTGGPFVIASGGLGKETPPGTFHVINKVQAYTSKEYPLPNGQPAPMPWAVFFEPGGIAFHGGDPQRASSGCVHLDVATAQNFFHTLSVGDEVQVVQSKNGIKNAFYKAHHVKPPTKQQIAANELGHTNAVRKAQGLPPLPASAASSDAKSSDAKKTSSDDKKSSSDSKKTSSDADKTSSSH
jgi:hypothetical protein